MNSVRGNVATDASIDSFPALQETSSPRDGAETAVPRKEVDYYLNPTELFRWINYRRWDGAKARVISHPDECSTWIVSRHNSDGRILWRHLPLHLVCMQSETGTTDNSAPSTRQIEALIDALLDAYPEAASSPDDQGMLPIHLTLANTSQPNERILNQLLLAYPNAVDVKDRYGRSPLDIVHEKAENGPCKEVAIRAMSRAKHTTQKLVDAIREENANQVAILKQSASNERMASQRIIMRLEEELESSRGRLEDLENRNKDGEGSFAMMKNQLEKLKEDLEGNKNMIQLMKRERDDLNDQNEILRNQLLEHEKMVKSLHQQFGGDRQELTDKIAKLRSEVSTSKAMAEALESQLRSRFTNEEYLATTVSELETRIADLKAQSQQEKTKLLHERDVCDNENVQLRRSVEELTKKSNSLQLKLNDLNQQMTCVLTAHGALNAEHDRLLDASLRTEAELVEIMRLERSEVLAVMKKQWEVFNSSVRDQEKMLEDFQLKEIEILRVRKEERERSLSAITIMKQEFHEARVSSLERKRIAQTEKSTRSPTTLNPESVARQSESLVADETSYELRSASSSQTTRRNAATVSSHSRRKSPSSTTYTSKSSRHSMQSNLQGLEARVPLSSEVSDGDRRQGPATIEQVEGNLLHLLETRADQGIGRNWRQSGGTESTSYGTSVSSSGQSSSFRNAGVIRQKPRMIKVTESSRTVNFTDGSTTTSSSTPVSTSISRTTESSLAVRAKSGHQATLDDFSNNSSTTSSSGSIDESDTDSSSRDGSLFTRNHGKDSSPQYGMIGNRMRMGMIRISEEASQSDIDSRYSHQ